MRDDKLSLSRMFHSWPPRDPLTAINHSRSHTALEGWVRIIVYLDSRISFLNFSPMRTSFQKMRQFFVRFVYIKTEKVWLCLPSRMSRIHVLLNKASWGTWLAQLVECLPLAQGVIPGSHSPCREPASPCLCLCLSLGLS